MARNVAFEILYKDYYARVLGLCRRLLSSSEMAEDAAQEIFMRAYKSFRKYNTDQPFWYWIASIANNHCVDLLRRQSRTEALFDDDDTEVERFAAVESPVLNDLVAAQDTDTLNRAIADLPDKYRVPLVLAYFNQSSYDDIAEALKISRNHVGVLLLRAKQRLRIDLSHENREVH